MPALQCGRHAEQHTLCERAARIYRMSNRRKTLWAAPIMSICFSAAKGTPQKTDQQGSRIKLRSREIWIYMIPFRYVKAPSGCRACIRLCSNIFRGYHVATLRTHLVARSRWLQYGLWHTGGQKSRPQQPRSFKQQGKPCKMLSVMSLPWCVLSGPNARLDLCRGCSYDDGLRV